MSPRQTIPLMVVALVALIGGEVSTASNPDTNLELDHSNLERMALTDSTRYDLDAANPYFRSTTPGLWNAQEQVQLEPAFPSPTFYRLVYKPNQAGSSLGADLEGKVFMFAKNHQNIERKRNQLAREEKDYSVLPLSFSSTNQEADYDSINLNQRGLVGRQKIVAQQRQDIPLHRLRDFLVASNIEPDQPRIMRRGKCLKDSKSNNPSICDSGAYLHAADYTTNLWDAAGRR